MRTIILTLTTLLSFLTSQAQTTYEECVEQALKATYADSLDKAETLFKEALKKSPADHRNSLIFYLAHEFTGTDR